MKRLFKKLSLHQHYMLTRTAIIGCVISGLIYEATRQGAFLWVCVAFLLFGFVYPLFFVRCPHCNKFLLWYEHFRKLPRYCPECGRRIDYDATEE